MQRTFWMWIAVAAVAVLGAYALGEGLTGLVVSQSCCTPSSTIPCPIDSLCPSSIESYAPRTETPGFVNRNQEYVALSDRMLVFEGIAIVTAALVLVYAHLKREMQKTG